MKINEILLESGILDAALRRGWVLIRYTKLNGKSRVFTATRNPAEFVYNYKRTRAPLKSNRNIPVWERGVGWRSLRRNRIIGWEEISPETP